MFRLKARDEQSLQLLVTFEDEFLWDGLGFLISGKDNPLLDSQFLSYEQQGNKDLNMIPVCFVEPLTFHLAPLADWGT